MQSIRFRSHRSGAFVPIGRRFAVGALLGAAAAAISAPTWAQEFSYNGDTGPGYWSELDPAWETCGGLGADARQSPIDLRDAVADRRLRWLRLRTYPTTIDIFNNGHTIEQSYEDTGSTIVFDGRQYYLQQFHFHTLSEHTVRGSHSIMEMHGVFQNGSEYVVVAQLFKEGRRAHAFLQTLIDAGLPARDGDSTQTGDPIDFRSGLTHTGHYYTYAGSLTTPPCSETVTWVVLARPAPMSADQYQAFRGILGNNFRPLQSTNDRQVRRSVPIAVAH